MPSDEHYTYEHPVKLNTTGFRDTEILAKQPREYRILAIGDSHLYGQGLGDSELLTTVLEEKLYSAAGTRFTSRHWKTMQSVPAWIT